MYGMQRSTIILGGVAQHELKLCEHNYVNADTMHSILYYVASALIYYVVRVLPPLLGAAHLRVGAHDH